MFISLKRGLLWGNLIFVGEREKERERERERETQG